ncbi:MAG: hypothetical protein WCI18_10935 [Pseudomonadota bacterium]
MRFLTILSVLLTLTACGGVTFRNKLCQPVKKAIPTDYNGTYSVDFNSGSSLSIPGFRYSSKSYVMVDVEKGLIRTVLPQLPGSVSQGFDFDGGFCPVDDHLYYQEYQASTSTWSLYQLGLEPDGFSMQFLTFVPSKLAQLGFDYIIKEPDSYFSEQGEGNGYQDTSIVVNNPEPASDMSSLRSILRAAGKSSVQFRFVRIEANDKINALFKSKGKTFSLYK